MVYHLYMNIFSVYNSGMKPKNPADKFKEFTSVRMATGDLEIIRQMAEAEERTLSQMIRILVREGMAARGRKESPVSPGKRKHP